MLAFLKKLIAFILFWSNKKAFFSFIKLNYGKVCRFVGVDRDTFGSEPYLVTIGDHVTIAEGTRFITHDGGVWVLREKHPDLDVFGKIHIGDNVFIGLNSIILPGTIVGNNVVIGAGSVVRGVISGNSVVAGVPAKRICAIDEYEQKKLKIGLFTKQLSPSEKVKRIKDAFRE